MPLPVFINSTAYQVIYNLQLYHPEKSGVYLTSQWHYSWNRYNKKHYIRGDNMKVFLILVFMITSTLAIAGEVDTECSAMNENREKVIKTEKPKVKIIKGSSQQ